MASELPLHPTGPAVAAGAAARCAGLVRIYRSATGETHALRGIDATFPAGVITAVTGPSGSGKSSLLSVLALRERQSGGELWIGEVSTDRLAGRILRELRRHRIGWVAQRPTHSLFGHLTALDQLEQSARLRGADLARGVELLEAMELSARGGARTGELSGGEQQRLAIATALVGVPALVVADEPTAELDDASSGLVLRELRRCADAGGAVVFATHDARAVAAADRVLHLRHGVISTEAEGRGPATATIDSTGRIQLPPEALERFPGRRARIVLEPDGVRLLPPDPWPNRPPDPWPDRPPGPADRPPGPVAGGRD
jgi:putative ABC transport system ATP-binding protein